MAPQLHRQMKTRPSTPPPPVQQTQAQAKQAAKEEQWRTLKKKKREDTHGISGQIDTVATGALYHGKVSKKGGLGEPQRRILARVLTGAFRPLGTTMYKSLSWKSHLNTTQSAFRGSTH